MASSLSCFILAGGKSSRFGSNKSIANVNGTPMARVVANKLFAATQMLPRLLGADEDTARAVGLVNVSGPREGNGPLGAIVDALELSRSEIVLFSPNDTPYFSSTDFRRLMEILETTDSDAVVASNEHDGSSLHWLLSAWRTSSCLQHLREQYSNGVRSVHEAVVGLTVRTHVCTSSVLRNINRVSDMFDEGTI